MNAKFAAPAVKAHKARAMTTTASALPVAEVAAIGPEIASVAVTCFAITPSASPPASSFCAWSPPSRARSKQCG